MYTVALIDAQDNWYGNGQFRVEEFKLPLLNGHLKIVDQGDSGPLVSPSSLDADIQISYVSGGPAGGLPVSVSGVLRDRQVRFADYEDYRSEERRVGKECERTCRSRRSP